MSRSSKSAWKGLLAGAAGGLAATLVLDGFGKASLEATRKVEDAAGGPHTYTHQQEEQFQNFERAHIGTVENIAQATGASLTERQKKLAAPATHYLFGTLAGAAYGLLAEYWPSARFGFGTAFGISLQLGATEGVLPALGLMPSPLDTPLFLHAGGFASHAVYGASTEGVRRLVRKAL